MAKNKRHEMLRQRISSICSAFEATEDKALSCMLENEMELHIDTYEVSQGLSEMEKPLVENVFLDQEGIVWATIDGEVLELDGLLTDSLAEILSWLEEAYHIKAGESID